jgi:hypothetical protein
VGCARARSGRWERPRLAPMRPDIALMIAVSTRRYDKDPDPIPWSSPTAMARMTAILRSTRGAQPPVIAVLPLARCMEAFPGRSRVRRGPDHLGACRVGNEDPGSASEAPPGSRGPTAEPEPCRRNHHCPRTKGSLPLHRPAVISLSVAEPPHRGRGTHIPPGANRDRSRRRYPPPSPTAHLAGRTGGSRYALWTGIWDGRGASSAPSGGISGST